ncbi:hypothetical protein Ddye_015943 [Dipteronia dyeriana]|uniref:Uncharacterized protein n=1 Tax=Dipteronia dyeriana TaxID=168575 RepID=A0AAD9U6U7_9ROSI|nr:hypothetical protein Ddye_015943 [Dipteronia dyeriana]
MTMHRQMKFSCGVIHRLLLQELHHDGPTDEMWFMLGNHSVRFSKVELYLITGLQFRVVPDTTLYARVENGIKQWYFTGIYEVSFKDLRVVLSLGEFQQPYDAIFSFEMIPDLDIYLGIRRATDLSPRILK